MRPFDDPRYPVSLMIQDAFDLADAGHPDACRYSACGMTWSPFLWGLRK